MSERVKAALVAARDCILIDRTALADSHFDHGLGRVDDDGQDGLDEYDVVLAQIDAALAELGATPRKKPNSAPLPSAASATSPSGTLGCRCSGACASSAMASTFMRCGAPPAWQ